MERYGFNGQITEMKIFILFILRHVLDPLTLDELGEMVLIDENMNYFLYCQGVSELADAGLVFREPRNDGQDAYTLSPHGYDTLEPVEATLPSSLRRAGWESAHEKRRLLRRKARIYTEVLARGEQPVAVMILTDGCDPILHIELQSGTPERARQMCACFKENAERVFDDVLRVLLGE